MIVTMPDPVRYGALYLALKDIKENAIYGALAECGVFTGRTSKFIHEVLPDRRLYLFDTFEGFDPSDLAGDEDKRFRKTSSSDVLRYVGNSENLVIRKGYFPNTTIGVEEERFSFVLIDFDKHNPTLSALEFFYPRLTPGGYLFVHDFNSPESDWACSRALRIFLSDKPEKPIGLPDMWGSAVLRKL